jgi:putative DNA primase/helicase
MIVVSSINYYKNISTPRHPTWFPYYRSTAFPTQIFRDLLEVRPYIQEDSFSWQLPFNYDPQAKCPTILAWLNDAVGVEHAELLRAFARAVVVGYCFGQVYLEAYGPGGTGKSTFANLVRAVVGNGNTVVSGFDRLKTNRFELSGFVGKRLAILPDQNPYVRDVSKFKALTGLDPLPLEFKQGKLGNHFVFHGLCIVTANEPLQSIDKSSGLGRRRLLVPFSHSTREWGDLLDFREDQVIGRFAEELPGFFNYLLAMPEADMRALLKPFGKGSAGLQSTFREGLLETNVLAQWSEDCLAYDPEAKTSIGIKDKVYGGKYMHDDLYLYPSYLTWSEGQGKRETMTMQNFSRDLVDLLVNQCGYRGIDKKRIAAGYKITGVRLRKEGDVRIITGT